MSLLRQYPTSTSEHTRQNNNKTSSSCVCSLPPPPPPPPPPAAHHHLLLCHRHRCRRLGAFSRAEGSKCLNLKTKAFFHSFSSLAVEAGLPFWGGDPFSPVPFSSLFSFSWREKEIKARAVSLSPFFPLFYNSLIFYQPQINCTCSNFPLSSPLVSSPTLLSIPHATAPQPEIFVPRHLKMTGMSLQPASTR